VRNWESGDLGWRIGPGRARGEGIAVAGEARAAEFQVFRERTLRFPDQLNSPPTRDTGGFNVGSNLRPVSVIDPRRDQRQLSHHSGLWMEQILRKRTSLYR
jgi:hypothetical protein